jgi:eukaryotic-like serine/threonine-protein kinase
MTADGSEQVDLPDPVTATRLGPGASLGPYRIQAPLGQGGMGIVYRAHDTRLDRSVAIKVLPPDRVADPERERRFVQEAKAASALNHPNIVTIHEIQSAGGVLFIAMEHVEGSTLADRMGRRGLPLRELLRVAVQIADALAAAHARGIVHRDLKPGNVMVTPDGHVKVLDFGLAKLVEPPAPDGQSTMTAAERLHTMEGRIVGTPAYMSPEQALGQPVDARSDVFAFGSVLYEMATGQRAFPGENTIATLSRLIDAEPPPARTIRGEVPRDLERVIELCLKKDPARRLQSIADVKLQLEALAQEWDSGVLRPVDRSVPARTPWRVWPFAAAAAGIAVVAASAWLWLTAWPGEPPPEAALTRLTYDAGLATDPALSPDGRLLVYASDREGAGTLDLWVQQVGGGEPVRLTRDAGVNREPAFSPDGTRIVFRSTREGGGIFVMPALGGAERRIAPEGRRPVFAPDGRSVAYYVGSPAAAVLANQKTELRVVAASGGSSREVATGFVGVCCAIWTPDGRHLLFLGNRDDTLAPDESLDWWVVPIDGARPIKTGALAITRARGLQGEVAEAPSAVTPAAWTPAGDGVIFSAQSGSSTNLWQVGLSSKTFKAAGPATRLTAGTAFEWQPSVAALSGGGRRMVFASLTSKSNLWSVSVAPDEVSLTGQPQRLTDSAAVDKHPYLSDDGRRLAYVSARSGFPQVWVRDVESGRETAVTSSAADKYAPLLSSDGSLLVYSESQSGRWPIHLVRLENGEDEILGESVVGAAADFTPDGRSLLFHNIPGRTSVLDLASRRLTVLLEKPGSRLIGLRLSPDDRWVAFSALTGDKGRIVVAPRRDSAPIDERDWTALTDGRFWDIVNYWSRSGNVIYFTSNRDGYTCFWAQRLDPVTKRPSGPPEAILHEHNPSRSLGGFSFARNRFVFNMDEPSGSIWMAEWKTP